MKRIMNMFESCKTPIKVAFFGFALISIGFLIQNENVNIFYTIRSNVVLFAGELALRVGEFIVMNLPIIFMLNIVCKKANNASPVVMALVGYFSYLVTTMLIANQNLGSLAYSNGYGINSIFNITGSTRLPLETGMIGSLLVAYATRLAFVASRHRSNYNLSNMFSKETAGIIYSVIFCFIVGVAMSYGYPFLYTYLQKIIAFISNDLLNPLKIGIYSVLDRVLSILGLGNVIRYPFWFTSAGGSYQNTLTGQSILGDVNIWSFVKDNTSTYLGAGRFITPYYVINLFMIPGIYIGTYFSITDKRDRLPIGLTIGAGVVLSIVAGNPLPFELLLLFTSPLLLLFYLGGVGIVSYYLVNFGAFLGFKMNGTNTIVAMPGSFPDFIVNIRNANLTRTINIILIIGLISFVVMMLGTMVYYRVFAFDFTNSGKGKKTVDLIIQSVGGPTNIIRAEAGLFKLHIYLDDPGIVSIEQLHEVGTRRVVETRNGIVFELGTSSFAIAKRINRICLKRIDKEDYKN